MSDDIFGALVFPDEVEAAVIATCQKWFPEYLALAERKLGFTPEDIPEIGSWVATADLTRWPEEQLPSVLVMNTGLAEEPKKYGGDYTAKFAVGLAVVASGQDGPTTDRLVKIYTAILRAILTHHPDLGDFATAIEWVDEGYDALPSGKRRRDLGAGQLIMRVEVESVISDKGGIAEPRENPYEGPPPDGPVVTAPGVNLTPTPLD